MDRISQAPGTAVVTDKDLSGQDTETFFAGPDLGLLLIRPGPARMDEKTSRCFPNWLRQRLSRSGSGATG